MPQCLPHFWIRLWFIVNEQRKWFLQSISSVRKKQVKGISFIKLDNNKNDKMTVAEAEKFDSKIMRMQQNWRVGHKCRRIFNLDWPKKDKEMTQINWEVPSHQKAPKTFSEILSNKDILGFVFISVIDCASLCHTGRAGRSSSSVWLELRARRDPARSRCSWLWEHSLRQLRSRAGNPKHTLHTLGMPWLLFQLLFLGKESWEPSRAGYPQLPLVWKQDTDTGVPLGLLWSSDSASDANTCHSSVVNEKDEWKGCWSNFHTALFIFIRKVKSWQWRRS